MIRLGLQHTSCHPVSAASLLFIRQHSARAQPLHRAYATASNAPGAMLSVGSPAPRIDPSDLTWVKGDPTPIPSGQNPQLIEFFASWCPHCRRAVPRMSQLAKRYRDRGVDTIGISIENDPNAVGQWAQANGDAIDYKIAVDNKGIAQAALHRPTGGQGVPHGIVLDRDGRIAYIGHPMDPEIESVLDKVSGGGAAAPAGDQEAGRGGGRGQEAAGGAGAGAGRPRKRTDVPDRAANESFDQLRQRDPDELRDLLDMRCVPCAMGADVDDMAALLVDLMAITAIPLLAAADIGDVGGAGAGGAGGAGGGARGGGAGGGGAGGGGARGGGGGART